MDIIKVKLSGVDFRDENMIQLGPFKMGKVEQTKLRDKISQAQAKHTALQCMDLHCREKSKKVTLQELILMNNL